MPNCAPLVAAVVTLPASVSAKATISPGPATARYFTHHGRFAEGASSGGSGGRVVRVAMIAYLLSARVRSTLSSVAKPQTKVRRS